MDAGVPGLPLSLPKIRRAQLFRIARGGGKKELPEQGTVKDYSGMLASSPVKACEGSFFA